MSDGQTYSHHWGIEAVDLRERSLPGLKMTFLLTRVPSHGSVVEIGCGEGKILRTLAVHRPDLDLHGCDVRDSEVAPDVFHFHKMARDIPSADATFDLVLIFDVLEHVEDPDHILAESARVLRPGGRLIACIPVEGERVSFYNLFRRILGPDTYVTTKGHVQSFTHNGVRAQISEHFSIVSWEYAYHLLGHFMDAAFFAAAKLKSISRFWWNENSFYNPQEKEDATKVSRALNCLLRAGNAAAWAESRAFAKRRFMAAAVLVEGRVRQ